LLKQWTKKKLIEVSGLEIKVKTLISGAAVLSGLRELVFQSYKFAKSTCATGLVERVKSNQETESIRSIKVQETT